MGQIPRSTERISSYYITLCYVTLRYVVLRYVTSVCCVVGAKVSFNEVIQSTGAHMSDNNN